MAAKLTRLTHNCTIFSSLQVASPQTFGYTLVLSDTIIISGKKEHGSLLYFQNELQHPSELSWSKILIPIPPCTERI